MRVHVELGRGVVDGTVVERERFVVAPVGDQVEPPVPPDMAAEGVAVLPMIERIIEPVDAFLVAPLHFHHVRHGMDGPHVVGVPRHRLAAEFFGGRVIARLLQPEGTHAQDVAVIGDVRRPARQHRSRPAAQARRVAEPEAGEVVQPECEDIQRMIRQDRLPALAGADGVAAGPGIQGLDMAPFARARAGHAGFRLLQRIGHGTGHRDRTEQHQHVAPETMRHAEPGIGFDRGLQRRHGGNPVIEPFRLGGVVGVDGGLAGGGQWQSLVVEHLSPPPICHEAGTDTRQR